MTEWISQIMIFLLFLLLKCSSAWFLCSCFLLCDQCFSKCQHAETLTTQYKVVILPSSTPSPFKLFVYPAIIAWYFPSFLPSSLSSSLPTFLHSFHSSLLSFLCPLSFNSNLKSFLFSRTTIVICFHLHLSSWFSVASLVFGPWRFPTPSHKFSCVF